MAQAWGPYGPLADMALLSQVLAPRMPVWIEFVRKYLEANLFVTDEALMEPHDPRPYSRGWWLF